jgi:predicted amidohydrolase
LVAQIFLVGICFVTPGFISRHVERYINHSSLYVL